MEQYLISGGLITLFVGSLIAVKVQAAKHPTYKEMEERYQETKLCEEVHKQVNEKLACLPQIKDSLARVETNIGIILKRDEK